MKSAALSSILLLSLQAFATISAVQSNANWTCSGTTCISPNFTPTGNNLIVVWTFWQASSGAFTASVSDNPLNNTFYQAVGPTLQSNAGTPTTAQIFYAKKINGGSPDTVKVTFTGSGSVTAAGVVVVEYSGADQSNPLDSVSAGYSTTGTPTNLLDSGNVAPANSNLLVFGAGFADQNLTTTAGSGFTKHQANNGTWGTGLVEDNSSAISGNNVLQRATACIGSVASCPGTTAGNWLMQMAVFRDASWTVASHSWSQSARANCETTGLESGLERHIPC
jgi:hypothetical protein